MSELQSQIDYGIFAADTTRADLNRYLNEAREQGLRAVCVSSGRVELAYVALEETEVKVVALVGFPFGANDADAKRYEAELAVDQGAHEIAAVINIGRLKDGDEKYVLRELRDLVEAADERPVSAILETHLLTLQQKTLLCRLIQDSGVKSVTTATDVASPAVSTDEIHWLRTTLGDDMGIKAVGQIRIQAMAEALLKAGANTIGVLPDAVWW